MDGFKYILWSHDDTEKLRQLLIDGKHSWSEINTIFPNRTRKAIAARAEHIRCRNMYYVYNTRINAFKSKKAVCSSKKSSSSNKPKNPANEVVSKVNSVLLHANGRRVNYA